MTYMDQNNSTQPTRRRHENTWTGAGITWERSLFRIALIGQVDEEHSNLLLNAGYRVQHAQTGDDASRLFAQKEPFDLVVLDFELADKPPEAILIFARRVSPATPFIAIVDAEQNEGYRRAFLAGARDVLCHPADPQDLLAAIDLSLEPIALTQLVRQLQNEDQASAFELGHRQYENVTEPLGEESSQARALKSAQDEIASLKKFRETNERERIREYDRSLKHQEEAELRVVQLEDELGIERKKTKAVQEETSCLKRDLEISKQRQQLLETRFHDAVAKNRTLESRLLAMSSSEGGPDSAGGLSEPALKEDKTQISGVFSPTPDSLWTSYQDSLLKVRALEKEIATLSDLQGIPNRSSVESLSQAERSLTAVKLSELKEALEEAEGTGQTQARETDHSGGDGGDDVNVFATPEGMSGTATETHLINLKHEHARTLARERALHGQLQDLQSQVTRLQDEVSSPGHAQANVSELQDTLDALSEELAQERKNHGITKERLNNAIDTNVRLAREQRNLDNQRHQATIAHSAEMRKCEKEIAQLHAERKRAAEEDHSQKERIMALEEELQRLTVTIAALMRDRSLVKDTNTNSSLTSMEAEAIA